MRRLVTVLAVAMAAVAASPARAAEAPRLAEAAGARFPDRAYALTLPRPAELAPTDVEARENGHVVPGAVVERANGADGRRFGVVLAIDVSGSMRGKPLAAAVAAARAFVAHRNPQQPVALVTFAGDVRVALGFSTDDAAIERALDAIEVAPGGSRILDAAARSAQLIRAARLQSGSVVLLSDGADHESVTSLSGVAAVAASAHVRVYTVGLRSPGTDFGALNLLAATTHGEFSATTSLQDLARVYGRLGSLLAHQYVVRYRSPAGPGEHVRVDVRVPGFSRAATLSYTSPRASLRPGRPFHRAPSETVWLRPGTAVGVSLFCALVLGGAVWLVVRPRRGTLRGRLRSYVTPAEPADARAERGAPSGRAGTPAARSRGRGGAWWDDLREKLDVGRVSVSAERLVTWVAGSTLLLLVVLPVIAGTPLAMLAALAIPMVARSYVEQAVRRQRKLFTEQLPDNLQVMASAMRAGHSFAGALSVVTEDAPEPTQAEFRRVIADERLGVPIDEALGVAVRRMQSSDLEHVALVAALQRETGGNTAEVLERVTDTVRERVAVRRMIKTLTAQGRMSRWVLTAIPIALLAFITVVNPAYVRPLYVEPLGQALLALAAVMLVAGSVVIKRIVDIKV